MGRDRKVLGISIVIKPYRKSSGGRMGRTGESGKKATVTVPGQPPVELRGSSFKDVCRQIRERFRIPSGIPIPNGTSTI